MDPRPMFPLGTVLLPTAVLPLHVFEPRYRELVRACLADDRRFGIVLIERGSEVGGGDVRTDVGTLAEIADAEELPDGRWAVIAVGTTRLRVDRWLADDPYPRARVTPWPDTAGTAADVPGTIALLRRVLGLRAELGEQGPPATSEVSADPVEASYQIAALAPFGPLDRQRALEASDAAARCALLRDLLAEECEVLDRRLAEG